MRRGSVSRSPLATAHLFKRPTSRRNPTHTSKTTKCFWPKSSCSAGANTDVDEIVRRPIDHRQRAARGVVLGEIRTRAAFPRAKRNIEDANRHFRKFATSPEVGDRELLPETTAIVAPSIHWHAYSSLYSYVPPDGVPPSTGTESDARFGCKRTAKRRSARRIGTKPLATVDAETTIIWWTFTLCRRGRVWPSAPPATGSVYPTAGTDIVDGPWIGWFNATKPGQQADLAMLDFVFSARLYATDLGSGAVSVDVG